MFGFQLTVGAALVVVGLVAQWLIKKRLQHKDVKKIYMWIAWIMAALGGTALSINVGDFAGVTSIGATVISCLGLLWIVVDLADKRPDWPAFILITIIPSFMKASAGLLGKFFDLLLLLPSQFTIHAGTWFGF